MIAQSCADREIGPALSIDQESVMHPARLTAPKVGLKPVTPQRAEGAMIDPNVSVPMAKATNPAEVAEADPADEPLAPCFRSHGFFVFPPNQTSPLASAPEVSFATSIAPASSNLLITEAVSSIT